MTTAELLLAISFMKILVAVMVGMIIVAIPFLLFLIALIRSGDKNHE